MANTITKTGNETIAARWALKKVDFVSKSHKIYMQIIDGLNFLNLSWENKIAIYWPAEREVDTLALIDYMCKSNYNVVLYCYDELGNIALRKISGLDFKYEYIGNRRQATNDNMSVDASKIGVAYVAVDGYNGDKKVLVSQYQKDIIRSIKKKNSNAQVIALAFDFQKTTKTNYKVDKVVIG